MLFLLSKNGLCMWISAYPLVEIDDFMKVPHLLWAWDFVNMYLTHLGIRVQRGSFHIYLKKWFFWTPKDCLSPLDRGKQNFFFNFECYDLANGKEWVSYKILQLEIPKLVTISQYLACFQKGLFGGDFEQKHPWSFRG
jgi:hypothetical protein